MNQIQFESNNDDMDKVPTSHDGWGRHRPHEVWPNNSIRGGTTPLKCGPIITFGWLQIKH